MGGLASKTVGLWRQYSRSPRPAWPRRRPGGLRSATSPRTALSIGCRLDEAWLVPLERALPVRRFGARKGQRHLSGLWWSATTGGHVGFESWLERDHLVALDFDRSVTGIASQPFWLYWTDPEGKRVSHAPDYFARRADGSAVVLDCRPSIGASRLTWPSSTRRPRRAHRSAGSTAWPVPRTRSGRQTCGGWPGTGIPGIGSKQQGPSCWRPSPRRWRCWLVLSRRGPDRGAAGAVPSAVVPGPGGGPVGAAARWLSGSYRRGSVMTAGWGVAAG